MSSNNLPWHLSNNTPTTIPVGSTVPAGVYVPPIQNGTITTVTTMGGQVYSAIPTMPVHTPHKRNSMIGVDRASPLSNHVMYSSDGIPAVVGHLNDAHQALRAFRMRVAYLRTNQHMGRLHRPKTP